MGSLKCRLGHVPSSTPRCESKEQSRNRENPKDCSVENWLDVAERFIELCGDNVYDRPLAVYLNERGRVCNICDDDASNYIRQAAKEVYEITDEAELNKRFTCHSLRVGACNALVSQGYAPDEIQKLLRWRSESWKDYVRDLTVLQKKHNEAINNCKNIPFF